MSAFEQSPSMRPFSVVALVASLGGLSAVTTILRGLPAAFPATVLVVQHGRYRPDASQQLADVLQCRTALRVRHGENGMRVTGPGVIVVPTGCRAVVRPSGHLVLVVESPSPQRSQVGDDLLTSLAGVAGRAAIGVVLTGLGSDGARGVRAIKAGGGRALAQEPGTAQADSMPVHALATGCVDFALPLQNIASALVALVMAPGGAELLMVPTPPWARLSA